MIRNLFIISVFISIFQINAFAEVKIFLLSTVGIKGNQLFISDIARIDSREAVKNKLADVRIPDSLYDDGSVYRKEVSTLIKNYIDEPVIIYGSAVRVNKNNGPYAGLIRKSSFRKKEYLIRYGDRVSVVIKKNGIHVEVVGVSMKNAVRGDVITVRLKGSRRLKGRVAGRKEVEVSL